MEQLRKIRSTLLWLLLAYGGLVAVFFSSGQFQYYGYGLTVYRGILLPLVDVLVRPDGLPWIRRAKDPRLITVSEVRRLIGENPAAWPDALILGTGSRQGARVEPGVFRTPGPPVEVMPTAQAVSRFNELRAGGSRPAAILHVAD